MNKIYIITNLVNGKTYVGQQTNNKKHYYGSGLAIKKAIKKYGKSNFRKEIIVEGDFSKELLNELEKHYIKLLSPHISNNSYNLTEGGEGQCGWVPSEECKKNMSIAAKKRMEDPEQLERLKNLRTGTILSIEHIEALIKANIGNQHSKGIKRTPEVIEKIAKLLRGKTHTEVSKKNMSEGRKGIKFSEEHKRNLSLARKKYFEERRLKNEC